MRQLAHLVCDRERRREHVAELPQTLALHECRMLGARAVAREHDVEPGAFGVRERAQRGQQHLADRTRR